MKFLISILLLSFVIQSSQALTVTSLNLQWFGRGGQLEGELSDEYRAKRLTEFLKDHMKESDVYVFQEVLETQFLANLFPHLECFTHDPENKYIQHIVLCADASIIVGKIIEKTSALGRFGLRPVPVLKVKNENGDIVSVAGVHLKSGKTSTEVRLEQVKKLKESQVLTGKAIIIGDFNAYDKETTGLSESDITEMEKILNPVGFSKIANDKTTFISFNNRIFDWAWTKGFVQSTLKVVGPCDQTSVVKPFKSYGFFKRFISDHCALQVTL